MRPLMLTLAVCSGCSALDVPEEAATTTARGDALTRRGDDDGIIIMNGLEPASLGENLLLNDPVTRAELLSKSLTSRSFESGRLHDALVYDARAGEVMRYLVRCALGRSSTLVTAGGTFRGELELCPDWAVAGVSTNAVCQQQVTACLLSLSNVVGRNVPVSIRGNEPWLTAAATMTPRLPGEFSLLTSSLPCTRTTYGVAADCGWESTSGPAADAARIGAVFACKPNSPVQVGAGSTCGGGVLGEMTAGDDKVLRICPGFGPCNHSAAIAESQGACGSIRPYAAFNCPDAGAYVVMQRDYAITVPARTPGTMVVGQRGHDGTRESTLFPVREGAFFGNLFEGNLTRLVTRHPFNGGLETTIVSGKPIFEHLYSCFDAKWNAREAYESARLCGLTDGQCLSNSTGACQTSWRGTGSCTSVVNDSPVGSGSFLGCKGKDGLFYDNGLTTFLRNRCDLISNDPQDPACKQ